MLWTPFGCFEYRYVYQDIQIDPLEVLQVIKRRFREQVRWTPLQPSGFKINFDVACRHNCSFIAAACRDHEGSIPPVRTSFIPAVQPQWGQG